MEKLCAWCSYEVPRMILLNDLKLDCNKDMSVHISTCASYDLYVLTPVVWKF